LDAFKAEVKNLLLFQKLNDIQKTIKVIPRVERRFDETAGIKTSPHSPVI